MKEPVKRFSLIERNDIVDKSQECLTTKDGIAGLNYLKNVRKLSDSIIQQFRLGYVPDFVNHQLAGRIIFPVYDPSNNLIAISSRKISEYNYWHEQYEKRFFLYGMNLAKESVRRLGWVALVEGQFDVMQMHNHGIQNCVGLCGSYFSDVQYSVLQRYCDKVVVILDHDSNFSGQKSAKRILEKTSLKLDNSKYSLLANHYHHKITSVKFGFPTDPDEFLRKHGPLLINQMLDKAVAELSNDY